MSKLQVAASFNTFCVLYFIVYHACFIVINNSEGTRSKDSTQCIKFCQFHPLLFDCLENCTTCTESVLNTTLALHFSLQLLF